MYGSSCLIASWNCRFLKLDDLESFLQDSEKAAARDDVDDNDAEDRLGEGRCLCCQSLHLLFDTSTTSKTLLYPQEMSVMEMLKAYDLPLRAALAI